MRTLPVQHDCLTYQNSTLIIITIELFYNEITNLIFGRGSHIIYLRMS